MRKAVMTLKIEIDLEKAPSRVFYKTKDHPEKFGNLVCKTLNDAEEVTISLTSIDIDGD